jgi:hypothetical protein
MCVIPDTQEVEVGDLSSRPAWAKIPKPYLKNKNKRAKGVAQVLERLLGPQFNPQYHTHIYTKVKVVNFILCGFYRAQTKVKLRYLSYIGGDSEIVTL